MNTFSHLRVALVVNDGKFCISDTTIKLLVIYTSFRCFEKLLILKFVNDSIFSVNLTDETTLNSIPSIGSYSWEQTATNTGAKVITINASVSSELPYKKRAITVSLGSQIQTKKIETPLEDIQFLFDQLDSNSKSYPILITFTLSDENNTQTILNSTTGTVNIHENNGHGQLISDFFLLFFLILFIVSNTVR